MTRYAALFDSLAARNEGAFVPFVMVGDPTLDASVEIMSALVTAGADALEVGIPFSDPVADGPVIQLAADRALASGATVTTCWEALAEVRRRHPEVPIGVLTYANLVFHRSPDAFYAEAKAAGVDSVLVADVPTPELPRLAPAARQHKVDLVAVVPPNATPASLQTIAELSSGYSYVQGRAGVTGADQAMVSPARALIDALADVKAPPPVVGFGVSTPEHVRAALDAGARGAISGSAIVQIIEREGPDAATPGSDLLRFVKALKSATRP